MGSAGSEGSRPHVPKPAEAASLGSEGTHSREGGARTELEPWKGGEDTLGRGNECDKDMEVRLCRESEAPRLLGSRVRARGPWEAEMEGDGRGAQALSPVAGRSQ